MPTRRRDEQEPEPDEVPSEEVIYLPGADDGPGEPSKSYRSGWPQQLIDKTGQAFWRLRDGEPKPTPESTAGDIVLYGLITGWQGRTPVVHGKNQYTVAASSRTLNDVILNGGVWLEGGTSGIVLEETFIRGPER
jgi:hypothetical protein